MAPPISDYIVYNIKKTYFRIYDIYDFNQRDLVLARLNQDSSTPGVDYRIIIEGLQIGMTIQ